MSSTLDAGSFSAEDQLRFAVMSGDWNPIHTDATFARRTVTGKPVVHGIHLLLYALDQAVARGHVTRTPVWIEASFARFVLVGEAVALRLKSTDKYRLRLDLVVGDTLRSEIVVGFEDSPPQSRPLLLSSGDLIDPGPDPWNMSPEAMTRLSGAVATPATSAEWACVFPCAARWLGGERLAALGASSRLVGMISPGLHSVYMGLRAVLVDVGSDALSFVTGTPRHGLMKTEIAGGGITGVLTCLVRSPPHEQPRMTDLAGRVPPDAFAGTHALVVGGSRGLGEVTAKLLAVGGANVSFTYARGVEEARRVAEEIGSSCTAIPYDVAEDSQRQLARLAVAPTHVYYFATPQIARSTSRFFDAGRFDEMMGFFVHGFWNLATAIRDVRADARLFYPSTVYVAERPKGMAEYAMAKAAGEVLCAEITRALAPLCVLTARLPQLATDQTLTNHGANGRDPVEALLPILRDVQETDRQASDRR